MTDDETRARLREQAEREHASAWRPEKPGDEVVGVIRTIRASVATAYGPVPVVELEELGSGRPVAIWLIHTVLRNEFTRARPVPGESVLVRYLGKVQPESGGPSYESCKVVVDRLDEHNEVDWDRIAEHDPSAATAEADRTATATVPGDDIPF
jgi:hypothetical protein